MNEWMHLDVDMSSSTFLHRVSQWSLSLWLDRPLASEPPSAGIAGVCCSGWFLKWILMVHTQALFPSVFPVSSEEVLWAAQLSHFPAPSEEVFLSCAAVVSFLCGCWWFTHRPSFSPSISLGPSEEVLWACTAFSSPTDCNFFSEVLVSGFDFLVFG